MRRVVCILAAVSCLLSAGLVSAKVYWLPDFLQDNLDRVNDVDGGGHGGDYTCPPGWISEAAKGSMECAQKTSVPSVGFCYSSCVDPCSGLVNYDCSAFGCSKYYTKCSSKCETCYLDNCRNRIDNIINAEWGCQQKWADCATKCEIPYKDNCQNRQDKLIKAEWGCQQKWADCATKCEIPYEDNCRNRSDNTNEKYGCQKYWADCVSKCEVPKTCVPNDCTGFDLATPPVNAAYTSCKNECSNVTKYKFSQCNLGYWDLTNFVCGGQLCNWKTN